MFDDDPGDEQASFPCPACWDHSGGIAKQNEYGAWECDTCEWRATDTKATQ